MARSRAVIIIEASQAKEWLRNELFDPTNRKTNFVETMSLFFKKLVSNSRNASVSFGADDVSTSSADAVAANKSGTFTGLPAASDTISVGGQAFTFINTRALLVVQDLTYLADLGGVAGNSITIEYTTGGTAGAEVVTVVGTAISVQIENSVSTATQVKTAVDASVSASALISVSVSGTGSTAQVAAVPAPLASGAAVAANQVARDTAGLTATLIATATSTAINASTNANVTGSVVATNPSAGVVKITAKIPGVIGNLISLADSASNFTWAGAATALSAGTGSFPTLTTLNYGR